MGPASEKINQQLAKGYSRRLQGWWFWQIAYALWVGLLACLLLLILGSNAIMAYGTGAIAGVLFIYLRKIKQGKDYPSYQNYVKAFHNRNPGLEWSLSLLNTHPAKLNTLQALQRKKLLQFAGQLSLPEVHHAWPVPLILITLFLVFVIGSFLVPDTYLTKNVATPKVSEGFNLVSDSTELATEEQILELPGIGEVRLRVAPPAYTGQAARYTKLSTGAVPEGSRLTWQVWPKGQVERVQVLAGTEDTIQLERSQKGRFVGQKIPAQGFIYRIAAYNPDTVVYSEFYQLAVLADSPPQVQIKGIAQYRSDKTGAAFNFSASAKDDWGLTQVWLELTISRGSGENVQFTTQRQSLKASGKAQQYQLTINPTQIGMQVGDELYYKLLAQDNRVPRWQEGSSSSWYYAWQDTTEASVLSSGLALNIEPEYFRSQRQIIIDTEKLIKEQSKLVSSEFEKRSDNIGVDQKLLRLRYGKFLGEEFESTAGLGEAETEHAKEEDGEEHHTETHDHELVAKPLVDDAAEQNPLAAYAHAHDTEEGATFYEESIKAKLKTALSYMWDSELYLRTHKPKEALPHQYNALHIIKEIQQQTRVYVERVGFAPPVIRIDQVRLSGDRKEARTNRIKTDYLPKDSLLYLKNTVKTLSQWQINSPISAELAYNLNGLSQWLAGKASANTADQQYILLLNQVMLMLDADMLEAKNALTLRQELEAIMPMPETAAQEVGTKPLFKL